jgi:hypothetical protein
MCCGYGLQVWCLVMGAFCFVLSNLFLYVVAVLYVYLAMFCMVFCYVLSFGKFSEVDVMLVLEKIVILVFV